MDWVSTLIGAGIGFVSSVGIIIVERLFDRKGKLKIYHIVYNGQEVGEQFGFTKAFSDPGMISFILPIMFEIQNTSNTSRVIRDVCAWVYKDKKPVAKMLQIDEAGKQFGGDKNTYSFVSAPRSITKEICSFLLRISEKNVDRYNFDELVLTYYDERDKMHVFSLGEFKGDWKPARFKGEDDWELFKEVRGNYGREKS